MGTMFYVTVEGDRVEGPYETRDQARAVAAERATNEVHLQFRVEAVTDSGDAAAD